MNYTLLHMLAGGLCFAVTLNAITRRGGVEGVRFALAVLTGGAGLAIAFMVAGGQAPTSADALPYIAGIRVGVAAVGAGALGIGHSMWVRTQTARVEAVTVGAGLLLAAVGVTITYLAPTELIVRSPVTWHVLGPWIRLFDSAVVGMGTLAVIAGTTRRLIRGTAYGTANLFKLLAIQLSGSVVYFLLRWIADTTTLQLASPLLLAFTGLAFWTVLHRWRYGGVNDEALALLFTQSPTPSVVIDLHTEKTLLNPGALPLFPGHPGPEELTRRLTLGASAERMLCAHQGRTIPSVRIASAPARVFDVHCQYDAPRGIGLLLLTDVTERVAHAEQLSATVTELRHAQDQLVMQEKMAALGVLVAGVNHEINNPLAYVTANVTALQEYLATALRAVPLAAAAEEGRPGALEALGRWSRSAEVQELRDEGRSAAEEAAEGCARIRETVASMRTLSRQEDREQRLDLSELARAGLKIGRLTLAPSIAVCSQLDLPLAVRGGAGELSRVVTNLVVNAGQAMGAHGQLTVRSFLQGGQAVVEVSDTGPGISPELRKRIFEPFFTTKAPGEGTGLGLAISYETLRRHGGDLALVDSPAGACFQLRLPLAEDAQPTEPRPLALVRRVSAA
ncbi:MAG: ATP-binding protein [Myxococcota bacterium]|nr:ATP-binding protein [Myxococcota bacterium]